MQILSRLSETAGVNVQFSIIKNKLIERFFETENELIRTYCHPKVLNGFETNTIKLFTALYGFS
jgi:hypothetical protein